MKHILFLSILAIPLIPHAQLKTIYAKGGEANVDWTALKKKAKKEELSGSGPGFLYGSGCTDGPTQSKASSTLKAQGNFNYTSTNLHDWDPQTAWVEGDADYGIGEYFEVDLLHGGNDVAIFNGYQRSYDSWRNNSRVKKFKIYGDNKPLCYLILNDKMGYQSFDIPEVDDFTTYRFEIVEVYPGIKWKDVAISEITNFGCCYNSNTFIRTDNKITIAKLLKKGSEVTSVNIETNELYNDLIIQTAKQIHHKLLRVESENRWIELTPYHPFYVKGHGLTSLYKLKKSKIFTSYDEMINKLEVLVWNEDLKIAEFKPITNIKVLIGEFETYSIQQIEKGKNYIINGFITSVY